ncbi:MAG TPA: hypothetical protein VE133_03595, partial [Candidatus Sulfotelmatobacter sp.]|nr:hypothetical protein [Candidatus Sulfotelmatobacter sp.]
EQFDGALQYYDYGVVSLLLRFPFSGSWEELQQRAGNWIASAVFDDLCRSTIREQLKKIGPALVKPYQDWLSEDYYVIHLHSVAGTQTSAALLQEHGTEISQIVRGEVLPLSDHERKEVLQGYMSYYPNDLIVAGWNAAFLFDTRAGAEPTISLLEYANSQLLQFRHYDDLLTTELERVYDFMESRKGLFYGWRMRSAASQLRTILLDVTELTERTNNALKFVGDMFFARLHKLCAAKIGVSDYQALVQEKLRIADELYDFMIEQFHQARAFLLEFIVVVILLSELFFLFHGKLM